jgi:hypothetical protein
LNVEQILLEVVKRRFIILVSHEKFDAGTFKEQEEKKSRATITCIITLKP